MRTDLPVRLRRWLQFGLKSAFVATLLVAAGLRLGPLSNPNRTLKRDLVVVIEQCPAIVPLSELSDVRVMASLANRSTHRTYYVVEPGMRSVTHVRDTKSGTWQNDIGGGRNFVYDGAEIYCTADRLQDNGDWQVAGKLFACVSERPTGEIVKLKPGDRVPLGITNAFLGAGIDRPGRVRLFVHYRFNGLQPKTHFPDELDALDGIEPFELVSKPVEIKLVADSACPLNRVACP